MVCLVTVSLPAKMKLKTYSAAIVYWYYEALPTLTKGFDSP